MITIDWVRLRTRTVFYGWWIVVAAFTVQLLQTGLFHHTYGAYAALLREEYGWSKTVLALAYALQSLEGGLGPVQGWLIDRFGPRNTMRVGVLIFGVGFMFFSRLDSLTGFYITFGLTALGSNFAGFMPVSVMIVNWFERRRSLAIGLLQTGQSVGGLLVPLVAWSFTAYGWRPTAFVSGIIILVVLLPLTFVMRRSPEEYGLRPDGTMASTKATAVAETRSLPAGSAGFTAWQALKTRAFWCVSGGQSLAILVISAVMVHLVIHLDGLGYSLSSAANVIALTTGVMMVGRVVGGILGDRFDKRRVATYAMLGHTVGVLLLAFAESFAVVILFAIAHGLSWGIRAPVMHALRAEYFGRRSFATIMGFSSMVMMVGSAVGPLTVGIVADYYGNYRVGFVAMAVVALFGAVVISLARKPDLPGTAST